MALLTNLRTGRAVTLTPQALVGRSPTCSIVIDDAVVSSEHASLRWRQDAWWVRELGSRNGTWVDGRCLEAGEQARLVAGSRLGFGGPDEAWVLEDAGPPGAFALCLGAEVRASAQGSVLLLPSAEEPEVALLEMQPGRWVVDDGERVAVHDGQLLEVAGQRWQLCLPRVVDPTVEARPPEVLLRFRVSRDEEYVEIEVEVDGIGVRLRPRSFNYLLLTLARQRLEDADLPETTRGWVDQETLARRMGVEHRTVNVQLYRARQALGKVRPQLATQLVERRARAAQLRFGLDCIEVLRI